MIYLPLKCNPCLLVLRVLTDEFSKVINNLNIFIIVTGIIKIFLCNDDNYKNKTSSLISYNYKVMSVSNYQIYSNLIYERGY